MPRTLPDKGRLPYALYRADQVREFDRCAIEDYGVPGAELMERAGCCAFELLRERWPEARDVSVLCGVGNNGGDGYVVARLALEQGLSARVLQLGEAAKIRGDARTMAERYQAAGGEVFAFTELPGRTDVIVDAVFGTGLERDVEGQWAAAIDTANRHGAPILAVDIPSGLHADSGRVLGIAIRAAASASFIGLKQGMFTGRGPDHCGEVRFYALEVPAAVYARTLLAARRIDWPKLSGLLQPRRRDAHKGDFGHVLVVGGAPGFAGAARMAGEAALRCGAGLVSIATHPAHAAVLNLGCPELMCCGVEAADDLTPLLARAGVVAVGPGLGRTPWAQALLDQVLEAGLPLVVDADALNLLATRSVPRREDWILTPHPGEAARLLDRPIAEIQNDRFAALAELQARCGGIPVLKGAGTLVAAAPGKPPAVCSQGNPGMAGGGMGDVLTGLVAGFVAQGFELAIAAELGVCLHAAAGDAAAARRGERGLLATDLFEVLGPLLNPEISQC